MQEEIRNMKWYVLRVIGGKERKTVDFLEKEIDRLNMKDFVAQILVPTEKVYLVGEVPHVLKNVTNVLGFLGATKGGVPVPMRQSEINRILGKVDDMALAEEQVNIPFVVGENVKVIDGPFNSFNAEIEAIDEQKKKLQLMVKIFGRKTPLELNFMQVEKI
jgi:transcriptional antiterminator NusG